MSRIAPIIAAAALLCAPAVQAQDLAAGQVWTVKAPAADSVRVRIGNLESTGGQRVVSVSFTGVPCPPAAGCQLTSVAHMPFSEAILKASLGSMVERRSKEDPQFDDGYRQWKEAEGGYFTIAPGEALTLLFDTLIKAGAPTPLQDDTARR